jgi:uncharacterized MnhB-related membrane protein
VATPFDYLLIATLLLIAAGALTGTKLFKSAVLFIAFGLFMAVGWVRLAAPDIALAEAAIGAGVTGALMLDAVGHLRSRSTPYPVAPDASEEPDDA